MLPRAIPWHILNLVFTQLLLSGSPSESSNFPRGSLLGFCQKNPSARDTAFWKLGPTRFWLKHDLLRLEVAPSGKTACLMTHVFHETWETLASPAKRATECLGGQADKSSNRFKPSQVIHHQEAFPFLRNKKIPTKEESFSCLVYKLLRCNPEYIRQVCNRALKRV